MSKAWQGGSSRRWRAIRAAVLTRDQNLCRLRCPGTWRTRTRDNVRCQGSATQVHHIHGKARCRGCSIDDPSHLASACAPCNQRIGEPGKRQPSPARPRPAGGTQW